MSSVFVIIILISCILLVTLIFIYVSKSNLDKRNKMFFKLFTKAGSLHQLSFSSQEFLGTTIIGLDGLKKTLLIANFASPDNFICIRLAEIKSCVVTRNYESVNLGSEMKIRMENHLRSIDLKFNYKKSVEPISFSFYNCVVNSVYEIAALESKAKDWGVLLSKMISKDIEEPV
jgi:hypothetical protein